MARYTTAVRSPRSADEAFDALADFSTAVEWDPGISRAERVDDGPLGVGSAFDIDVEIGPGTLTFRYEITEFERPERVVLRAERPPFTSLDTITVDEEPDGCTVIYDARLTLGGLLGLAEPLLALGFRRVGDRAAAGLRSHLDGVAAS